MKKFLGWAMSCASYIFLERKFDQDKQTINRLVEYYKATGYNYQVQFI